MIIITGCLLMAGSWVNAQRQAGMKSRQGFTTSRAMREKARIICPGADEGRHGIHSLGLKLGDPAALTYKVYPGGKLAFAFDLGRPASGLYSRYFREKFGSYASSDTLRPGELRAHYANHRVLSDLSAELKALYHFDADIISKDMRLYAGVGWQWRRTRLRYDFVIREDGIDPGTTDRPSAFERIRTTMGPELVAGIEYTYPAIPIVAFIEVEYFSDVQADPGWTRFEGGAGLRYLF